MLHLPWVGGPWFERKRRRPRDARTVRRGGVGPAEARSAVEAPPAYLAERRSSFRIVPIPRFFANSELPLLLNRST